MFHAWLVVSLVAPGAWALSNVGTGASKVTLNPYSIRVEGGSSQLKQAESAMKCQSGTKLKSKKAATGSGRRYFCAKQKRAKGKSCSSSGNTKVFLAKNKKGKQVCRTISRPSLNRLALGSTKTREKKPRVDPGVIPKPRATPSGDSGNAMAAYEACQRAARSGKKIYCKRPGSGPGLKKEFGTLKDSGSSVAGAAESASDSAAESATPISAASASGESASASTDAGDSFTIVEETTESTDESAILAADWNADGYDDGQEPVDEE